MIWLLPGLLVVLVLVLVMLPFAAERMRRPIDARGRRLAGGDFVELSRGLTYYQWIGPVRGPVVVCVHGLTTPSYVWLPLAELLNGLGIRVLIYDLYGRGLSDRVAGRQDRAFFVEQLDELLVALEVTQGVTLMGYSMGGAIAAAYAVEHPALVDRLVLLAPVGLGHRLGRFLEFGARVPVLGDGAIRVFGALVHRAGVRRSRPACAELPDLARRMAGEMDLRGTLPAVLSSQRGMMAEDLEPVHRRIAGGTLPVLAIWGGQDKVIPLTALGRLAQINRRARQVELEDAGHGLPYTHAAQVFEAVREFLREVPAG